jgi:hypothetical protein
LLLRDIVINYSGVGSRVKNLSPLFIRQEVDSLIDVLIEAIYFAKCLEDKTHRKELQKLLGMALQ